MHTLNLVHVKELPIFEQLQLEEALLRANDENWCIINESSPMKAIVMGIPEKLIDLEKQKRDGIPLIKRFSGGGTVIVDEKTLFVSLIFGKEVHSFDPFPKNIMEFTASLFQTDLRENDYVIGEKKYGGNAQYILKDRWLHHTSFLWDFDAASMDYLRQPEKQPEYRQKRSHLDFLCKMRDHIPSKEQWIDSLKKRLEMSYQIKNISLREAQNHLSSSHRKATALVQQDPAAGLARQL